MSLLKEKVAFLRGLAKGMELNEGKNQGEIINSIIDALDEFAEEVDRINNFQTKMQDQVNIIDEDLGALEDEVYDDELEDEPIEISCPHCEEMISFSEDEISEDGEVECPVCHKAFEVEWECECSDCKDCTDKE